MSLATVARNKHPVLQLVADAPTWDGAACHDHDPEMWFHDDFTGPAAQADTAEAKNICEACPIRDDCLTWALAHRIPFGVWGGLTADERGQRNGQCRTCTEPIPPGSKARYCQRCRALARARQNRSRVEKTAQKEKTK